MTLIKIRPHAELCPSGVSLEAKPGEKLLDVLLEQGIEIEHACDKQCACTTCHVYLCQGRAVNPASEKEEDMLDKAWGVAMNSRLSCQVVIGEEDLEVEIPKYTVNLVSEGKH